MDEYSTARHEAGHVVVALVLGQEFVDVSIGDEGDAVWGRAHYATAPAAHLAAVHLAGPLAVRPRSPGLDDLVAHAGGGTDCEKAFALGAKAIVAGRALALDILERYDDVVTAIAAALVECRRLSLLDCERVIRTVPGAMARLLAERRRR